MSLSDDLKEEVAKIYKDTWETRDGNVIPGTNDIQLGNHAVKLNGTVLYADLADSTGLVKNYKPYFAAEIYKAYLICACRIIRAHSGIITAFDGDRVMSVFIGDNKNTSAVTSALKIKYAVDNIVNTGLKLQYPNTDFIVRQSVGVDTSDLWIARTGIRGSNDLVWVGKAANYAAKMCSLRDGNYSSWITADVYNNMNNSVKLDKSGSDIWQARKWTAQEITVYRSSGYISF